MMETSQVTHEQIYERLCEVEKKVTEIDDNTKVLVEIAKNLEGFITVCRWIGKIATPILWLAGLTGAITMIYDQMKGK
jgi:hypothetical protein